ncbi:UNVERIFIED_CONTAM: hypothetical protein FKN15_018517 [Acipenser sinensis]
MAVTRRGDEGQKGDEGEGGKQGKVGPPGPKGDEGQKGDEGEGGKQGKVGPPGPKGLAGEQGSPGDIGMMGKTGPIGAKGLAGEQGSPGDIGMMGKTGPIGAKGSTCDCGRYRKVVGQLDVNIGRLKSSVKFVKNDLPSGPHKYRLEELAYTRSGDKGDTANIGVVARHPLYYPYLKKALTAQAVEEYFQHLIQKDDTGTPKVRRYELPGINGLNFVLRNSLGGGGVASLRSDPQFCDVLKMIIRDQRVLC